MITTSRLHGEFEVLLNSHSIVLDSTSRHFLEGIYRGSKIRKHCGRLDGYRRIANVLQFSSFEIQMTIFQISFVSEEDSVCFRRLLSSVVCVAERYCRFAVLDVANRICSTKWKQDHK